MSILEGRGPVQKLLPLLLVAATSPVFSIAPAPSDPDREPSMEEVWSKGGGQPDAVPSTLAATCSADLGALRRALASAPAESPDGARRTSQGTLVSLPMPDGSFARFRALNSPVMEAELAAKHPEIQTFSVVGEDDPQISGRFSVSPAGLTGLLHAKGKMIYLDSARGTALDRFEVRSAFPVRGAEAVGPTCVAVPPHPEGAASRPRGAAPLRALIPGAATAVNALLAGAKGSDGLLRTYRLAVGANHSFEWSYGNDAALTYQGIVATINNVNAVFQEELGIRFLLVGCEDQLIDDPNAGSKWPAGWPSTDVGATQAVFDTVVTDPRYDVGVLFSGAPPFQFGTPASPATSPGIWEFLGSTGAINPHSTWFSGLACHSGFKGQAIFAAYDKKGYFWDMEVVAHGLGHVFGAGDTNFAYDYPAPDFLTVGLPFRPYDQACAVEPGSGSTLMSSAGLFKVHPELNVEPQVGRYFHNKSLQSISDYVATIDGMQGIPPTVLSNHAPVVDLGPAKVTVPACDGLELVASASDPDVDTRLTYCWEPMFPQQYALSGLNGLDHVPKGNNPRSFPPSLSPVRVINPPYFQPVPFDNSWGFNWGAGGSISNWACTVRDNNSGGGGVAWGQIEITVAAGQSHKVSYPNAGDVRWQTGTQQTVTWSFDAAVSSTVDILLWDGTTWYTLAAGAPNTGSAVVTVPALNASYSDTCRVKVRAAANGHVRYFSVSENDFTVTPNPVMVLLKDGAESVTSSSWTPLTMGNWSDGIGFTREKAVPHSGAYRFKTNAGLATYKPNLETTLTSPYFLMSHVSEANLYFYTKYQMLTGDFLQIQISPDGATWVNAATFAGTSPSWPDYGSVVKVPLSSSMMPDLVFPNYRIRFRFITDSSASTVAWGVAIDDIVLIAQ